MHCSCVLVIYGVALIDSDYIKQIACEYVAAWIFNFIPTILFLSYCRTCQLIFVTVCSCDFTALYKDILLCSCRYTARNIYIARNIADVTHSRLTI